MVLSSFVKQLSISQDGSSLHHAVVALFKAKQPKGFASNSLTIEESGATLVRISHGFQTTLILDALDECDNATRVLLMDTLENLVAQSTTPIKLFISSRPEQDIKHRFKRRPKLAIQATDNHHDIAMFVKDQINKSPEHWRRKLTTELRNDINTTLDSKSERMYVILIDNT